MSGAARFMSCELAPEKGFQTTRGRKQSVRAAAPSHGLENESEETEAGVIWWRGKTGQTEKGLKGQARESGIYAVGNQVPTGGCVV